MDQKQEFLIKTLKWHGASLIGFGDVSFLKTDLTKKFPVAISFGVKYDERIVENLHSDEESFHNHLIGLNVPMERLKCIIENLLSKWGYQYTAIPFGNPVNNNQQLKDLRIFPHKTAATSAGLGWIGKCALFVTAEFGPRIRLGTVLTNARFRTAKPVVKDTCRNCTLCVNACPYGAIYNVNWERGMEREKLFDAFLCNEKRLEYIPIIGRKHSCSLCLQACDIGKRDQNLLIFLHYTRE